MSEPDQDVDPRLRAAAEALPPIGPHPDEDAWVALQSGMLSQPARRAVADHVASCASCAVVYRAISLLTAEAQQGGLRPPIVRNTWLGASRNILLMAGMLVAAVGLVVWIGTRSEGPPAQNLAPRPWALVLTAPAVQLPARYVVPAQGADEDRRFVRAFGDAIAPYRAGDYANAAVALDAVAARFPDIAEAAFYLGVSRLLAGDAQGARTPLANAARAGEMRDAARWFGAAAAEQAGRPRDADAALDTLCKGTSEYRDAACAALGQGVVPARR